MWYVALAESSLAPGTWMLTFQQDRRVSEKQKSIQPGGELFGFIWTERFYLELDQTLNKYKS